MAVVRFDHSFAVGARARLDIDIHSGSARIEAGAPGVITLAVDSSNGNDVDISQLGDSVALRPTRRHGRARSMSVMAVVPDGAEVNVTTASGDIRLLGSIGAARLYTASGEIEGERVGRAVIKSTSGDIRVGAASGDVVVATTSGDITFAEIVGRVTASSTSGDVRITELHGGIDASTTSGDITVRRCLGDELVLKSISGDVRVGLPSGIRVDPEISTLSGSTTLPQPSPPSDPSAPRRRVRLRINTVSGDVRIERA